MTTLKISDLSVGDWVRHDFYELDMRVIAIYGDNKRIIAESSSGYGVTCHLDHFNPIPITAEILEKNGFECIEEDADTALYGTPSCSIFHTRGTLRYRLDTPQASVVCWNIHDLQHALRLAGVDKEINL